MNLLSADRISKSFTEKWLFRNISFGLSSGEKLALVGHNGSGKTTLLKVIAGIMQPDSGEVARMKGISIGYLPQEPLLDPELTVEESIFSDENPLLHLVKLYERAVHDENFPPDEMQSLLERMDAAQAWDFEQKASQILGKLGIHNLQQRNAALSGGQKKRVALARLLISRPDVLIMDEPTNHLDLEAIEWLENLLTAHQISLIMVTHDRYFLDNVATGILELDGGNLYAHPGKYAVYLENHALRDNIRQTEVARARNLMKKELEWMRRMPKARGTKSKSRIEAFYDLKEKADRDTGKKEIEISVGSSRLGNKIIEAEHIGMRYGDVLLLEDFSYIFKKKDRIGVVGRNGAGKSTLLDILSGRIQPHSGRIIHGPTLRIGYYTQHSNTLNDANRIIDEVKEIAEYITLGNGEQVSASKLLDMFLFPPSAQHTPVSKLSGGERRRLQLLKVLTANPNFLILDEPTNDLDIDTLNVLEDFLENYDGCLLMVSHDRYFMDRLVEHLFVFEGDGKVLDFYGNYTDYRETVDELPEKKERPLAANTPSVAPENTGQGKKLSFKEKRELEQLENEMAALESRKAELNALLSGGSTDHAELLKWSGELEKIEKDLGTKGDRWLELSDI